MSLGNTLRAAREACGLTTSELAARTHMLVQIVEGLENEDFRRIPAPIYGRGFIKLYCEAVNMDPKPLQAEFMDLFNKSKDAPEKSDLPPPRTDSRATEPALPPAERPVEEPAPSSEPLQSAEPDPDAEPIQAESLFDLPVQTGNPEPAVTAHPPKRTYEDFFKRSYAAEETPAEQSAAEKFRNTMSNVSSGVFANVQKLPPNTGRIIAVSVCAAFILTLIGWGVFELYKATTPVENTDIEHTSAAEAAGDTLPKPVTPPRGPSVSVKPGSLKLSGIEVPPLYID